VSTPWIETIRIGEVGRPGAGGAVERRLAPDGAMRAKLARFLDLERLDALEANVRLTPWFDGARLDGHWTATITQLCGVSLDPLVSDLSGDFVVHVVPSGSKHGPTDPIAEVVIDLEADDPPDVLEGDVIDLAGYVIEHLVLEIDPFPRAPGAEFSPPETTRESSPFAKLADWKSGDGQS
jgi:uncharacterized metal-binding protein YceD (DUF177 family)